MSNPMNYDWFESHQRDDGGIDVYAGWGQASHDDFNAHGPNHAHFGVDIVGGDFGRSGPRGTPMDY